jgi:hypothetical protein
MTRRENRYTIFLLTVPDGQWMEQGNIIPGSGKKHIA